MLRDPATKYRPFTAVDLPDRRWPTRRLAAPPIWMSTDLRDGNQALFEPMDAARKLRMFRQLVAIGFKEIEVAFPAASETDFGFVRQLIREQLVPQDVTIEVLTQARPALIERSIESLLGARRAIVHVYNATAANFRRLVFQMDRQGVRELAVASTRQIKALTARHPETEWVFQYSPETFTATELEFSLEVCNAVVDAWDPDPAHRMILNLPATVELGTPNHYADQIEWMHRRLARRDSIVLSVHPHNDRGTAVAAAELALLAGAERVEGCLFGNGERTGNVDLVTLALNLYTQGIDPGLDFSPINDIVRTVEHCNQLPVHPRHPYAGDLVFTAFSGSHQDAVKKGMAAQSAAGLWEVPYLPVDPVDLGRSYESVIRINSQSGKGGIAYLLERDYQLVLPRRLQIEFSQIVQARTDASGRELSAAQLWELFSGAYLADGAPLQYVDHQLRRDGEGGERLELRLRRDGVELEVAGRGSGPVDALVDALRGALGRSLTLVSFEQHSRGAGSGAQAVAYVEIATAPGAPAVFGVGLHASLVTASVMAIISGVNRAAAQEKALVS